MAQQVALGRFGALAFQALLAADEPDEETVAPQAGAQVERLSDALAAAYAEIAGLKDEVMQLRRASRR